MPKFIIYLAFNKKINKPPVHNLNLDFNAGNKLKEKQADAIHEVIRILSKEELGISIPEIAAYIKASVPTTTRLIQLLVDQGIVLDEGKRDSVNGRKPTLYALNKDEFCVVGVEILSRWIHVNVSRMNLEVIHKELSRDFVLEDTEECLNYIVEFVEQTIAASRVQKKRIIGIGVGIVGGVDGNTGQPVNLFRDLGTSLKSYLEKSWKLPVIVDNDTRAIGIAEQVLGLAKGSNNAVIVKISRELGLCFILNGEVIFGESGLAGNIAHSPYPQNKRLCKCGKQGCLGTVVGGQALLNDLEEALTKGEISLRFNQDDLNTYKYHDILDAAVKGDGLAIQLIQSQGMKLGQALGSVLNLLNPNLVVIAGEYVMVGDYFMDAIRMGARKTAMVEVLTCCKIEASLLGRYLGSKAASAMVLKAYDLIGY